MHVFAIVPLPLVLPPGFRVYVFWLCLVPSAELPFATALCMN